MPLQLSVEFNPRTLPAIVAGLASVIAVLACCAAAAAPTAPTADASGREIVVRGSAWAQGVIVSRHDILIVPPPAHYDEWRVHIPDDAVVRLLTTGDRVRRPTADGWRLEAVGVGETTVEFVAIVPPGEPSEPHFTLRVAVK
jgi:hypothetical protein